MSTETPATQTFHLAHQDGIEMRSVLLSVTPSQVHIGATDQGPAALHIWGRDGEYEFWVDVKAKAFPALVFALLKEKYEGNGEAVGQFRTFCTDHNVPHKFWTWS